jgi:tagatose-1,6-bisphosphate aldolase
MLALDHRQNLRKVLRPDAPDQVSADELSAFKIRVVSALAPEATAVLLDPEYGAAQCSISGALPPTTGLAVALEATGFEGTAVARTSRLLPGWSPEKARCMGADAVKLLVYYHPAAPTAGAVETLVREVAQDCLRLDLPLMVEPLSYSLHPERKLSAAERREVVVETARRLTLPGVDLLKAEFPGDPRTEAQPAVWLESCREVSAASRVPWVLLSAGVDFETYLHQAVAACQAGASGVAAGRAVWKEMVGLPETEQEDFLQAVAAMRMKRLAAVCTALGRPIDGFFEPPALTPDWFTRYPDSR